MIIIQNISRSEINFIQLKELIKIVNKSTFPYRIKMNAGSTVTLLNAK